MAYELLTTPGGNAYLGPNGTFAQLVDGFKAMAANRDQLDRAFLPVAFTHLADTHLDKVTATGRYYQNSSVKATPTNGYPPGVWRGVLEVLNANGTFAVQVYWCAYNSTVHTREWYGNVWSAWKQVSATEKPPATGSSSAPIQAQRDLSTVGEFRPDATEMGEGQIAYWSGPWGTRSYGSQYRGEGYVGKVGDLAGYTAMQIAKVQTNNEIEVSCLNPVKGRHLTIRVQGERGVQNTQDDQRRVEEVWVGAYAGTTVSKDLLVMPRSNIEWAFQIDVGGNRQFVPYHGTSSGQATEYEPPLITDLQGNVIDLGSMGVGEVRGNLSGFKLRQRLYLTHPDSGSTRWAAVEEMLTITPRGLMQSEATITFLRDTVVTNNYGPMTPADQATFDQIKVLGGAAYPVKTTAPATTEYVTVAEGHGATSFLLTSTSSPERFVAMSILDPQGSLLVGNQLEEKGAGAMRFEQRSFGSLTKIYPGVFASGSTVPSGTVWRPSAQWRFGEAPGVKSLV